MCIRTDESKRTKAKNLMVDGRLCVDLLKLAGLEAGG